MRQPIAIFLAAFAFSVAAKSEGEAPLVPHYTVLGKTGDLVSSSLPEATFTKFEAISWEQSAPTVVIARVTGPGITAQNDQVLWLKEGATVAAQTGTHISGPRNKQFFLVEFETLLTGAHREALPFLAQVTETPGGSDRRRAFVSSYQAVLVEGFAIQAWWHWNRPGEEPVEVTCERIFGVSAVDGLDSAAAASFSGIGITTDNDEAWIYGDGHLAWREGGGFSYYQTNPPPLALWDPVFAVSGPGRLFSAQADPGGPRVWWQLARGPYQRFVEGAEIAGEPAGTTWTPPENATANQNHEFVFTSQLVRPGQSPRPVVLGWVVRENVRTGEELLVLAESGEPVGPDLALDRFDQIVVSPRRLATEWAAVGVARIKSGGAPPSNSRAIFVIEGERDGQFPKRLLLREGDMIPVGSGDLRQVRTIRFDPSGFSSEEEIATAVDFTDGTSAAILITLGPPPLPDPSLPAPKIFASPDNNRKVTTRRVTLRGSASASVARVEWKRGAKGATRKVAAGTTWKFRGTLAPGRNVFFVRAVSPDGRVSAWRRIIVRRA